MFALVDCNNFYVSCQRVFQPQFNKKPVVVLSNNDGCVISRSEEAKQIGIKMGVPAFEVESYKKSHGLEVFSSNYTLYGDMSHRVMSILAKIAPEIEVYSIDECFLQLTGFSENFDFVAFGREIRQKILKYTGIPTCVGIARTKTLAKAANRIAKKLGTGVYMLDDEIDIQIALSQLALEDVWGIGQRLAAKLKVDKVLTALDFTNMPQNWVQKKMTVVGVRTWFELRGKSCIKLEHTSPDKKAICTSRSFGKLLDDFTAIEEAVSNFTARCAAKLRRQKSCAGVLIVFLYTDYFRKDLPQNSKSITVKLPTYSNSSIELIQYACYALKKAYSSGYLYKKAGVIVTDIIPQEQVVVGLFDEIDREKHRKIMQTLDRLNHSFGREKVKIGKQGFGKKWHLKSEHLSPCFTTKLSDVIRVN
ncbi:MAG: Y-family DNA polymerase [Spirosomataceae bacterium]